MHPCKAFSQDEHIYFFKDTDKVETNLKEPAAALDAEATRKWKKINTLLQERSLTDSFAIKRFFELCVKEPGKAGGVVLTLKESRAVDAILQILSDKH